MSGNILGTDLEVINISGIEVEVNEGDARKFKNNPPLSDERPVVVGQNQGNLSPGQPVEITWKGRRGGQEMRILGNIFKEPKRRSNT